MRLFWSAPLLGAALLSGGIARATDLPAPCAPAVRLDGERTLVAPIRASLQARGVAEGEAPPCQRLEVRVLPARPGYDLFLTDGEGRTDRRRIARADTAAMVIESWLQAEQSDPLLDRAPPVDAPPAPIIAASATAGVAPEVSPAVAAVAPPAVVPGRALASLRAERAIDGGGAMWWGVVAGACFRLGPLCVGPEAGVRISEGPPGKATIRAPVWQERMLDQLRSFEGGVRVELPLAMGPLRLLPGISLGAGRLSGFWHNDDLEERDRDRNRRDDREDGSPGRGDSATAGNAQLTGPQPHHQPFAELGLRAGAGLGVGLPLGRGLMVELQLGGGLRPVAPGVALGVDVPLAAGLVGHLGAGLGLRYGAL
jgi:hypothetical protein